MVELLKWWMG